MDDLTRILNAADSGDPLAAEELLPRAYAELRHMAAGKMAGERVDHTLQPTALVHEAWLRLSGPNGDQRTWQSRGQFFAAAAEAMRRILIESARRRAALKRGGVQDRTALDAENLVAEAPPEQMLEVDAALTKLEAAHPDFARVVKLRYFAGLTISEIAGALEMSESTVSRAWKSAKAWLYREMSPSPPPGAAIPGAPPR